MTDMAKIGRNAPCPCGKGRKFKHCCGLLGRNGPPPEIIRLAEAEFRRREAAEQIRRRDQGRGRPIIHLDEGAHRVVAVGNRLYRSTKWRFFADFLLDFLRGTLGSLPQGHPVLAWHEMMVASQDGSGISTRPFGGYAASLVYLAYALYLLAHHDQIPEPLLRRLRSPKFTLPAIAETYAGAAFAITGHAIRSSETTAGSETSGEFTATSQASGISYSVEVKRRDAWRNPIGDPVGPEFTAELQAWLRSRFRRAARKRLTHPVYWFELSIAGMTLDRFMAVREAVQEVLRGEEQSQLGGRLPDPAYVFVTCHGHVVNPDLSEQGIFGFLEPFRMPDFPVSGTYSDIETLLVAHDKHRDMSDVIKALKTVSRAPSSFEGTAPELMKTDGSAARAVQIGDKISLVSEDQSARTGVLEDVTSVGDGDAWAIVRTSDGQREMWKVPLSEEEAAAARVHGDAVFGKPNSAPAEPNADILTRYDRILAMFSDYPREALLRQLTKHPRFSEFQVQPG